MRKNVALTDSLEKCLAVYALAAGAAGVGLLATALPAQANIVFDNTHVFINAGSGASLVFLPLPGRVDLAFRDVLGHSSKKTSFGLFAGTVTTAGDIVACMAPVGSKLMCGGGEVDPGVLTKGDIIGAGDSFSSQLILAVNQKVCKIGTACRSVAGGSWANRNGYLGFKWSSSGKSYFGWAELTVNANVVNGETAQVFGLAYEACAGQPITAGQTSGGASCAPPPPTPTPEPGSLTLSLLALGAIGLLALRRKKLAA
ncbi:MAG: PEP-CTERM sorting domain-containing protein [Terriglobia bacterium]